MGTSPNVPKDDDISKGPQKPARPSIIFMIFDFLVFGAATALCIFLFLQP